MTPGQELVIERLAAGYGKVQVLWDVSVRVGPGEFVAMIGANGAGKTTTLRAVSGVVKPASGRITLGGRDITRASPSEIVALGLGHVPEGRELFPHMTVLENLELGAALRPEARAAQQGTLAHVYSLFPRLSERASQLAGTLSGGEQQMLAIVRVLRSGPKLLLLDEPSEGLAPVIVQSIGRIIAELQKEGLAVLLVEQNLAFATRLADRHYVFVDGEIVEEVQREDVPARHADLLRYLSV